VGGVSGALDAILSRTSRQGVQMDDIKQALRQKLFVGQEVDSLVRLIQSQFELSTNLIEGHRRR
jgi:hypothetical protein